jgi:hypothetical protein
MLYVLRSAAVKEASPQGRNKAIRDAIRKVYESKDEWAKMLPATDAWLDRFPHLKGL